MKSYTDLEQSKKLAEILPLESADMRYTPFGDTHPWVWDGKLLEKDSVPCWSLTALLGDLPEYIKFNGHTWKFHLDHCGMYYMNADTYETKTFSSSTGILIDDAFEMILKLKEKDLL